MPLFSPSFESKPDIVAAGLQWMKQIAENADVSDLLNTYLSREEHKIVQIVIFLTAASANGTIDTMSLMET